MAKKAGSYAQYFIAQGGSPADVGRRVPTEIQQMLPSAFPPSDPSSSGAPFPYVQNPDGSWNWAHVAIAGGAVAVLGWLLTRRRR